MSRLQTIARGRRFAEAQMTEQCRIERATGASAVGADGEIHPVRSEIWSGKCRLRTVSSVTSPADAAAQLVVSQDSVLFLPVVGTEGIRVNDVVTFTHSSADAALTTAPEIRVIGLHFDSDATARRLPVQVVT